MVQNILGHSDCRSFETLLSQETNMLRFFFFVFFYNIKIYKHEIQEKLNIKHVKIQGLNIHYKSNVGYSWSQIRKELKIEFIKRSMFMQEICNQL